MIGIIVKLNGRIGTIITEPEFIYYPSSFRGIVLVRFDNLFESCALSDLEFVDYGNYTFDSMGSIIRWGDSFEIITTPKICFTDLLNDPAATSNKYSYCVITIRKGKFFILDLTESNECIKFKGKRK